jgi:dihydrofolate synthase / folylpolyglutamate synthase
MTYEQTLDYLYSKLPMFHRIGPAAFKKDLSNTIALCEALDHPEKKFKSIHIAGTNGKGSVSHMTASILQEAGYKTGLYTSPHLVDFRERIRINGEMISKERVARFVEKHKSLIEKIQPSFFEVTVAMAFDYFAESKVDIAVIETGLGGRLDSTNIIKPVLSVITNISYDHQNMLGDTLPQIAGEKAGIIKAGVPVVIGKKQSETELIFLQKVRETGSEIYFAEDHFKPGTPTLKNGLLLLEYNNIDSNKSISVTSPLPGLYQVENIATVLESAALLKKSGLTISEPHIIQGITNVKSNTGLRGRWEILNEKPLAICDVAHNEAGLKAVFEQVNSIPHEKLHIVYGMVKDKDIFKALSRLPKNAVYYFCRPDIPRGLDENELSIQAMQSGLNGTSYPSVIQAYHEALTSAHKNDIVLVVGSIFIVAEVLNSHQPTVISQQ